MEARRPSAADLNVSPREHETKTSQEELMSAAKLLVVTLKSLLRPESFRGEEQFGKVASAAALAMRKIKNISVSICEKTNYSHRLKRTTGLLRDVVVEIISLGRQSLLNPQHEESDSRMKQLMKEKVPVLIRSLMRDANIALEYFISEQQLLMATGDSFLL